jgi:hypothetical protein
MARRKPPGSRGDILQGTLDMLILRTPPFGPAHGHHRARHRAQLERCAAGGARVAYSRALPSRGQRADRRLLGDPESNRRANTTASPRWRAYLTNERGRWSNSCAPSRASRSRHGVADATDAILAAQPPRRRARDELDAYVAHETAERMRDGLSADEARQAALRKLGTPRASARRSTKRTRWAGSSSWRQMALCRAPRQPGFALAAVLSLTLGIGANTAIFELLNAVRLAACRCRGPASWSSSASSAEPRHGAQLGPSLQHDVAAVRRARARAEGVHRRLRLGHQRLS